jgi:hypothetical protein
VADLPAQIADLQGQFQRHAALSPWVCLAVPAKGAVGAGDLVRSAAPALPPGKVLDANGQPLGPSEGDRLARSREWGRLLDSYGPPPWFMLPEDRQLQAVVHDVNDLTHRAHQLLLRVLAGPNRIPGDIREQIEEWDQSRDGDGWLRWVRYTTVSLGPHQRIENYPQVAVGALRALLDAVRPDDADGAPAAARVGEDTGMVVDWNSLLFSPPLTASEIAERLGQPVELVQRTLKYFRQQHDYGFTKVEDAGVAKAHFRYHMPDVLTHLQKWYVKRQMKAKKGLPAAE